MALGGGLGFAAGGFRRFAAGLFLLPLLLAGAGASDCAPGGFVDSGNGASAALPPDADGMFSAAVIPAENPLCFSAPDRRKFRPDAEKEERYCDFLAMDAALDSDAKTPVRLRLFVKDKDGAFFQTRTVWSVKPGESVTLRAPLAGSGGGWEGFATRAEWSILEAATIFACGVAVSGEETRKINLRFSAPRYETPRKQPELRLKNWRMPETAVETARMLESRFELTREYFNPFDPREVDVEFVLTTPDGVRAVYPAFFTRDFARRLEKECEILQPVGRPYWAFRYTPSQVGVHRVKIQVRDCYGGNFVGPERTFTVRRGGGHGFVRRSGKFFRFEDGTPFYPVGLNIHTVTDVRAEERFRDQPRPDRGTFDYDRYLERCYSCGINAVELWMASWGLGLEWTSRRTGYYGMGRYNLANAWALDRVLAKGSGMGIYFQLTLDNHGKLTERVDQEWHENPLFAASEYAAADGGMLKGAHDFFPSLDPAKDACARYYEQRNRYIASRFGANPAIFGYELWSEVDLAAGCQEYYGKPENIMQRWTEFACAGLRKFDSGKHLITNHVCGDYQKNLTFRDLWLKTSLDYVAGDDYFGGAPDRLMVDMLRNQMAEDVFEQPWLITEFGSPGGRNGVRHVTGEIHCGLWGAFFHGLPGTPFLWWHEFALSDENARHYRGFTTLTSKFDRSDPAWRKLPPSALRGNYKVDCEAIGKSDCVVGWLFRRQAMYLYPENPEDSPRIEDTVVVLDPPLTPGRYRIDFYDTVSAELTSTAFQTVNSRLKMRFVVPAFRMDVFFAVRPVEP